MFPNRFYHRFSSRRVDTKGHTQSFWNKKYDKLIWKLERCGIHTLSWSLYSLLNLFTIFKYELSIVVVVVVVMWWLGRINPWRSCVRQARRSLPVRWPAPPYLSCDPRRFLGEHLRFVSSWSASARHRQFLRSHTVCSRL